MTRFEMTVFGFEPIAIRKVDALAKQGYKVDTIEVVNDAGQRAMIDRHGRVYWHDRKDNDPPTSESN